MEAKLIAHLHEKLMRIIMLSHQNSALRKDEVSSEENDNQ